MDQLPKSLIWIGSTISVVGLAILSLGYLSLFILIPFAEDYAGIAPLFGMGVFMVGALIAFVGVLLEKRNEPPETYDSHDNHKHTR
jgi:uncharacterized membrane protein YGL010W